MRNAKIVCTLGPASSDRETIADLTEAGMAVARVNASHGTPEDRRSLLEAVQAVDREYDRPVATMLDLQGPEVRTADVDRTIELAPGDVVRFEEGSDIDDAVIGLSVGLTGVEPGDRILIDDGRIATVVTGTSDGSVEARVESGGRLEGRSGVNVPGVTFDIDVLTEKDEADLDLAVDIGVDFVAASFVVDGDDVYTVSEAMEDRGGEVPIIAKIERDAAVDNLDSIIEAAYGVMIARGDLGVECPLEEVPMIQKRIIRRCREEGVPVITATEMLDSMINRSRPTRAEASDVANAVLDGTDAVMLSGETAIGEDPVRVVETMARIIGTVEATNEHAELLEQRVPRAERTSTDALARSARYLARDLGAQGIVVASESGYTALKTTKFRPSVPIVAVTPDEAVRRRLALSWGILPQSGDLGGAGTADVIEDAVDAAIASGTVESGDTLVVLSGLMTELDRSTTNTLKVHVAAEQLAAGQGVVGGRAVGQLVRSDDGALELVPDGAIVYLPLEFDGQITGEYSKLAGIIHEKSGMTGYPAMLARELGIPMASGVALPRSIDDDTTVTLLGDRGVVYRGNVATDDDRSAHGSTAE